MKNHVCIVCGLLHDEAVGRPEDGTASGTRWANAPANRARPEGGGAKADFEAAEI